MDIYTVVYAVGTKFTDWFQVYKLSEIISLEYFSKEMASIYWVLYTDSPTLFCLEQWFLNFLVSVPFYTLKKLLRTLKSLYLYELYLLIFTMLEINTEKF